MGTINLRSNGGGVGGNLEAQHWSGRSRGTTASLFDRLQVGRKYGADESLDLIQHRERLLSELQGAIMELVAPDDQLKVNDLLDRLLTALDAKDISECGPKIATDSHGQVIGDSAIPTYWPTEAARPTRQPRRLTDDDADARASFRERYGTMPRIA